MNCENCGAPLRLIRDRDYFVCDHCGGFHFPSQTPEGIRLLDQAPDHLDCPVCQIPLYRATVDDWPGYHCRKCRGLFLDQETFSDVLKYRRSRAKGPPLPPRPLDPKELRRQIGCPFCGQTMETHPYYGPGNFVIDSCGRCRVIWLDHGEIIIATDAPGRDRGE